MVAMVEDHHQASAAAAVKMEQDQDADQQAAAAKILNMDEDEQQQEEVLEKAKAEMEEVKEENGRLKALLSRLLHDYQSLHSHYLRLTADTDTAVPSAPAEEPDHLVSLTLGSSSSSSAHNKGADVKSKTVVVEPGIPGDDGLDLALECPAGTLPAATTTDGSSSSDDTLEMDTAKPSQKNPRGTGDDGEVVQQQPPPAKKTRVSVRAKCDGPTMNDGCQWRKYGQKISKGNPCPRAYYRCTMAPACPVRKQVQRCADDMSILITTYEGSHSHPLPPAATAMASTTSAAATMLTAGPASSASLPLLTAPLSSSVAIASPAMSALPSCPTITLDLTTPAHQTHMNVNPFYGEQTKPFPSIYSTASSSSSPFSFYGGASKSLPAFGMQEPSQYHQLYQHFLQRGSSSGGGAAAAPAAVGQSAVITDTIAKAITADPGFQSVLAAAITSYMGAGAAPR